MPDSPSQIFRLTGETSPQTVVGDTAFGTRVYKTPNRNYIWYSGSMDKWLILYYAEILQGGDDGTNAPGTWVNNGNGWKINTASCYTILLIA